MSSSTTTTTTTALSTKMSAKPAKSKTVILKLSPDVLSRFPTTVEPSRKPSQARSKSTASSSNPSVLPAAVEPPSSENPSDTNPPSAANGTNTPSSTLAPPPAVPKRKGIPGPKPGTKRGAANLTPEGLPKPRGKPGPKKKPRLGDLINDPLAKGPFAAPAPIQKLGPKANQGAINAGLRALDRTGKPCRKWEKRGFQIKSFTGVQWEVPTWRAPKKSSLTVNGEVKSDTTSSSETKVKDESSAISDKSNSGADASTPLPAQTNGIANSPAPLVAVS